MSSYSALSSIGSEHLAAEVDFVKFCAVSICLVNSLVELVVEVTIAVATVLVVVATLITTVILIAVAALMTATSDFLCRFDLVRRYRILIFLPC